MPGVSMRLTRRLVALITLVGLVLAGGCAPSTDADRDTLRVAYNARPPSLDPIMTTATATQAIMRNVFEPLVSGSKSGEVKPMIAESWTISEDYRTFTFVIRPGVKFHNGEPVTTEDVAASTRRWMTGTSTGKAFFKDTQVEVVDDRTMRFITATPLFTGLRLLSDPGQALAIMPASVIEKAGASGVTEYIGTGPYKFVEWRNDAYVHLAANDDYTPIDLPSDGQAGHRSVNFRDFYYHFVSDPSTRLSGLQTGEYDAATAIPADNAPFIESDDNLELRADNNGFMGAVFNKKAGPMSDLRMRKAVLAAMDMNDIQIAAYAKPDYYSLNGALMAPEQTPWYSDRGVAEAYNLDDPELARRYLAEAGYAGQPIRILTSREYEEHYNSAVVLREQLRLAGMNAELNIYDWPTVLQRRSDAESYEIFITAFSPVSVPNQYVFLTPNWPGWTDSPAITEAMTKINNSRSEEEAASAAAELQVAFNDYLPMAKYGERAGITGIRTTLKGFDWDVGEIFWNATKG